MKSNIAKNIKRTIAAAAAILLLAAAAFICLYFTRIQTMMGIKKVTDQEDYNLYQMNIKYDYSIDDIINYGIRDNQTMVDAIIKEALPVLPVHISVPSFGCSAFHITDTDENELMGRNYDFKYDTSSMLVHCEPKDGYKSVAFAALDNISANQPEKSIKAKLASLAAPFICLDGMNEKGVSIAVLTLDSEPVFQQEEKPVIGTTIAIRLVLDRAASTKEAVDLLSQYNMFAANGRDYHFYLSDASGNGCVVEYDCNSEKREMKVTPVRTVTNFFELYKDKVLPNQKNGVYGHGRERYDKIEKIFNEQEENFTRDTAWQALKAAAQEPTKGDVTSNTQWSIVYNNSELTAEIALRRNWEQKKFYDLKDNLMK